MAVVERAFEQLDAEDAEDYEEGATDQDDVADGAQRRQESLYYEFETRGPVDHAEGAQGAQQPEDLHQDSDAIWKRRFLTHPQYPKDARTVGADQRHQQIHNGYDDERSVHDVPTGSEVGVGTVTHAGSHDLNVTTVEL